MNDEIRIDSDSAASGPAVDSVRRYFAVDPGDARAYFAEAAIAPHLFVGSENEAPGGAIVLSEERALDLEQRATARRLAGGFMLVPTIWSLDELGWFDVSDGSLRERVEQITGSQRASEGYLLGASRYLASFGLLGLRGADDETRIGVPGATRDLALWMRESPEVATLRTAFEVADRLFHSIWGRGQMRFPSAEMRAAFEAFRTRYPGVPSGPAEDFVPQVREWLDGLFLCPLLTAWTLPEGEFRPDGSYSIEGPSWLERAEQGLGDQAPPLFREVAEARGWGAVDSQGLFRLGPVGRSLHRHVGQIVIPTSYVRLYQRLPSFIRGDPEVLNAERDAFCDRWINIAGSGRVSSLLGRRVGEEVLRRLFDGPLEDQPAGLCDVGCGDGAFLESLVRFVVDRTERGKHLQDFPLTVVGADISAVSMGRTRERLQALPEAKQGTIRLAVVPADITQPDTLERSLAQAGVQRGGTGPKAGTPVTANDLLITMVFLVHDRGVVARSEQGGDAFISASYAQRGTLVRRHDASTDLVRFFQRWRQHCRAGLVAVDLHLPDLPDSPDGAWAQRAVHRHRYGLHLWGFHYITDQLATTYVEQQEAARRAGLEPNARRVREQRLLHPGAPKQRDLVRAGGRGVGERHERLESRRKDGRGDRSEQRDRPGRRLRTGEFGGTTAGRGSHQ